MNNRDGCPCTARGYEPCFDKYYFSMYSDVANFSVSSDGATFFKAIGCVFPVCKSVGTASIILYLRPEPYSCKSYIMTRKHLSKAVLRQVACVEKSCVLKVVGAHFCVKGYCRKREGVTLCGTTSDHSSSSPPLLRSTSTSLLPSEELNTLRGSNAISTMAMTSCVCVRRLHSDYLNICNRCTLSVFMSICLRDKRTSCILSPFLPCDSYLGGLLHVHPFDATLGFPGEGPHEKHNIVTLGVINITSLETSWQPIRDLVNLDPDCENSLDVLCCQETRVRDVNSATAQLRQDGWHAVIGEQPARTKFADKYSRIGYGGTMTLARFPAVHEVPMEPEYCFLTPHVQHVFVSTASARSGLHIYNCYLPAGNEGEIVKKREHLMRNIFQHATCIGNLPVVIVGDFQSCPEDNEAYVEAALTGEWADVLQAWYSANCEEVPATFSASRRWDTTKTGGGYTVIDGCIANNAALSLVRSAAVRHDCAFSGHALLEISFELQPYSDQQVVRCKQGSFGELPPKPKDAQEWDKANEKAIEFWKPEWDSFHDAILQRDVEKAYEIMCDVAVDYLKSECHEAQDEISRGRGPKLKTQMVCPPSHAAFGRDACSAADVQLARWFSMVHEAVVKCEHKTRCEGERREVSELWLVKQKQLGDKIDAIFCSSEGWNTGDACDVEKLRGLRDTLKQKMNHRANSAREARLKAWKDKIRSSAEGKDKSYAFKWIKNERRLPPICTFLKRPDGSLTANNEEVHKMMRDVWSKVYDHHEDDENSASERFFEEYASEIDELRRECKLEPICPHALFHKIQSKNSKTAGGLDDWRVDEVQRLPIIFWKAFSAIAMCAENFGVWPRAFADILLVSLPKQGPATPDNVRNIGLTPVFYSTYASVRYSDTMSWLTSIVPPDSYGGLCGRNASTSETDLSLSISEANNGEGNIVGLLIDKTKCFDMARPFMLAKLLTKLGLDEGIERGLTAQYSNLQRRFRVANSIGDVFKSHNGIVQGCSLSVTMINVLFAVLHKRMVKVCPQIRLSLFLDDLKFWLRKRYSRQFRKVWEQIQIFDRLSGQRTNTKKTVLFATKRSLAKTVAKCLPKEVKIERVIKSLGFSHNTTKGANAKLQDVRVHSAIAAISRIAKMPITIPTKIMFIKCVATKKWIYGTETQIPSARALTRLRGALLRCLWGSKRAMRCAPVVLSVVNDPLMEPLAAISDHVLRCLRDMHKKRSDALPRLAMLCDAQGEAVANSGLVGTLNRVLHFLGWKTHNIRNLIFKRDGEPDINLRTGSDAFIGNEIKRAARKATLRLTPERKDMQGLAGGDIDVHAVSALVKCGVKPKDHVKVACEKIIGEIPDQYLRGVIRGNVAGCFMDGPRLHAAGLKATRMCERCGAAEDEDMDHIMLRCPATRVLREKLSEQAEAMCTSNPLARRTGLVKETEEVVAFRNKLHETTFIIPRRQELDVSEINVYTDGACTHQQWPHLRLSAAGVVWEGFELSYPVPGPDQSALRAEIVALLIATRITVGLLHLHTDCRSAMLKLVKLLANPHRNVSAWNNLDLWSAFVKVILARPGGATFIRVTKVKGHAKQEDTCHDPLLDAHRRGNDRADEAARRGILKHHAYQAMLLAADCWFKRCEALTQLQALQAIIALERDDRDEKQFVSKNDIGGGKCELAFVHLVTQNQQVPPTLLDRLRPQYPFLFDYGEDHMMCEKVKFEVTPLRTMALRDYLESCEWIAGKDAPTPLALILADFVADHIVQGLFTNPQCDLLALAKDFSVLLKRICKRNSVKLVCVKDARFARALRKVPQSGYLLQCGLLRPKHPHLLRAILLRWHLSDSNIVELDDMCPVAAT